MDEATYVETRRSVHGVAELVLAGPRYRSSRQMRLRVLPDGIGTWDQPGPRFSGGYLVTDGSRIPVGGLTFQEAAAGLGLTASALDDVYHDGPGVAPSETIRLDPEAVRVLEEALAVGDAALAAFRPDVERVLWPEHFDVAITAGAVNYGVSPGDAFHALPYAYVGPHEPRPRPETGPRHRGGGTQAHRGGGDDSASRGRRARSDRVPPEPRAPQAYTDRPAFWNAPFGAARPLAELGGVEEVLAFFGDGQRLLRGVSPSGSEAV